MYINRIYVDHVALAWSLADSVRAQRSRTASIGGNPLVRLLRWLRKGSPLIGSTAKASPVGVTRAPIAFR
jgi:hypothetical protein